MRTKADICSSCGRHVRGSDVFFYTLLYTVKSTKVSIREWHNSHSGFHSFICLLWPYAFHHKQIRHMKLVVKYVKKRKLCRIWVITVDRACTNLCVTIVSFARRRRHRDAYRIDIYALIGLIFAMYMH
jgi:hypothetical protein